MLPFGLPGKRKRLLVSAVVDVDSLELILQWVASITGGLIALLAVIYLIFGWDPARRLGRGPEPRLRAWMVLSLGVALLTEIYLGATPHRAWDFLPLLPLLAAAILLQAIRTRTSKNRSTTPDS